MNQYVSMHYQLAEQVRASATELAPLVASWVQPASVLDVGCGNGTWLAAFGATGATDLVGLDGDYIDRASLEIPAECFRSHDLISSFDLGRKFDLAVCLEVAEHLPPKVADQLVRDLVKHAPVVLFSAAIPSQSGVGHINEQWPSYWVEKFASQGYELRDVVRPRVWEMSKVAAHYAQNCLIFVSPHSSVAQQFRTACASPLNIVHPRMWLWHQRPPLPIGFWQAVRAMPIALFRAVASRLSRRPRSPGS